MAGRYKRTFDGDAMNIFAIPVGKYIIKYLPECSRKGHDHTEFAHEEAIGDMKYKICGCKTCVEEAFADLRHGKAETHNIIIREYNQVE